MKVPLTVRCMRSDGQKSALERAIEVVGSAAELARRLNVTPQAIYQWSKVPAERVLDVERASDGKVSRFELRPDIFGSSEAA